MLKSKRINIILALIVAIVLWAYVLGEVNPESTVVVREVPITFTNQDVLEDSGLTLLSASQDSVNISISGQRTAITKVKQSDFSVTADLEALSLGENTVRLTITGPDDVKIESVSAEKISVTIDRKVTEEKEVSVQVNGEVDSEKEPYIVEVSKESINVTGAKSLVDKVVGVNAVIDVGDVEGNLKTLEAELVPVDSQGIKVENVSLENKKVSVTAVMLNKKTVNLEVPVINEDYGDVERSVTLPKTVIIKGTEDDLKGVSSITCRTLDLSNVNESSTIALEPILPTGIQISDESAGLSAKVTVKSMSKAEFSLDEKDINILNKDDEFEYTISNINFKVEATGKESVINSLTAADFTVSADVRGLGKGTHTVAIAVSCGKGTSAVKASVDKVEITIE